MVSLLSYQRLERIMKLCKDKVHNYHTRYDNDYQRIMLSLDEAFDLLDIK